LIGSQQYPRAAARWKRDEWNRTQKCDLLLLGVAQSRAKNFPKASAALQTASQSRRTTSTSTELGYAYEVTKQYAKALAAYEKGLSLAPNDSDLRIG